MSSEQPHPGSSLERSLLGGALSVEFSDCSVAAADLSKQAGKLMQGQSERREVDKSIVNRYVIGDGETPQRLLCAKIGYYGADSVELYGRETGLVIAQSVEAVEDPNIVITKTRRWPIPRKVETKYSVNELRDDPMLAVRVGNDTLLPIASFARRKNGQCSYV